MRRIFRRFRAGSRAVWAAFGGSVEVFLSTFRNRIDAKGRISVPAPFRALLTRQGPEGALYLGPDWVADATYEARALVAGGNEYLKGVHGRIASMPEFSTERADLEDTLLASMAMAQFDGEGRIVLPQALLEHAGLTAPGEAVFVGRGRNFQIWEPKAWAARDAAAKARLKTQLKSGAQP